MLADFSRKMGKDIEKDLLNEWGYFPSITMLRHKDTSLNSVQTNRYHDLAARLLPELSIPSESEELKDEKSADEIYSTISNKLLSMTRDTGKYPLLFKENINYGFRRNLLGLKKIGICLAVAIILLELFHSRAALMQLHLPDNGSVIVFAVSIFAFCFWVLLVGKKFVRDAAEDYGKQLLQTLETVVGSQELNAE